MIYNKKARFSQGSPDGCRKGLDREKYVEGERRSS